MLLYNIAVVFYLFLDLCLALQVSGNGLEVRAGKVKSTTTSTTKVSTTSTTKSTSSSTTKPNTTVKTTTTSKAANVAAVTSATTTTNKSTTAALNTSTSSSAISSTTPVPDQACENTAFTRMCWGNGFSIDTNFDVSWPNTGNTVQYTLTIENTTMAPDGFSRPVYAVNGVYPGTPIIANWGDTLEITVINKLTTNGTSIHWHGLRQWHTNNMDGTNGITECPLAPGQTTTYKFLCTQHGTSWYHSHHSDQYSDGVVGTIIINGPATDNYDVDLGTMTLNDWYHTPAFTLGPLIHYGAYPRGPPPADNILINGTNVNSTGGGQYHVNTLTAGKKYRLRLINISTNDNFKVGLDNHTMTVIASDFVPIEPFQTQWINIAIGQRYDVIIDANQAVGSYWFHVLPNSGCSNNAVANGVSIFTYAGATNSTPPAWMRNNSAPLDTCTDPNSDIIPYVTFSVPNNITIPDSYDLDVGFNVVQQTSSGNATNTVFQWTLNDTAMVASWNKPTLEYVLEGNTTYPASSNVLAMPPGNAWTYWIIQAVATLAPPLPHPIHLHGHDFHILGSGTGIYNSNATLNFHNPPRRDVAILPAGGWLVLAFVTDNPGVWLMHCHIAWHIGLGLGAQFIEEPNEVASTLNVPQEWHNRCSTWNDYYATAPFKEDDSGL